MNRLRLSVAALVTVLALLFNIERLDVGGPELVNIHTLLYVYASLAVLLSLLAPRRRRLPLPAAVALGLGGYLALRLLLWNENPLFGELHTYVTITEVALLALALGLAQRVAMHLADFEEAVANITFTDAYRRVPPLEEAMDSIQLELTRSRRYKSPLSLMVVTPDPTSVRANLHRLVEEVQRAMIARYVQASMARVISMVLRRTDLILEQRETGRFIIVSPETDLSRADVVEERVRVAIGEQLGVKLYCGIASFPDDALTFDDLLSHAEGHMRPPEGVEHGIGD